MTSKLSEAKDEGLIMQVVQKFDMHMKSFDSDKNTQQRWVWELIQNAKDTPNDFKQSKIKQELNDTQFVSKHNGNAFTIRQLHSVVAQYSTKEQNNDQERKTTGKYGTGFITTFLIGKVVSIEGFIRIEVDEEEDNNKKDPEVQIQKPDSMIVQENTKKRKGKNVQPAQKNQKSLKKDTFYYKKFEFSLDRHYQQRDKQLKKKVQRGDQLLSKVVLEGEMERQSLMEMSLPQLKKSKQKFEHHFEYVEKRTVDSYNTSFAYTVQDPQKFFIIEEAILSVQRLMPYAMLFNQNLEFYEFIDKRKNAMKKNLSFSIEKVSFTELKNSKKLPNFYIFTYLFKSEYDFRLQKFIREEEKNIVAYVGDSNRVYAGIPVSRCGQKWRIQKIGPEYWQLFKDFPLIGSAQIGWNAIINSDNFYPNEKRSQLMLTHIDKLSQKRVLENRKQLDRCFEGIKQLYLFLAIQFCVGGLQNLLIFSEENGFIKQFPLLVRVLKSHINTFCSTKFIPTGQKGTTKCSLKQVVFIQLSASNKQIHKKTQNQKSLSLKINQTFRCLYEDKNVINKDFYQDFYDKLHNLSISQQTYFTQNKIVTFINLTECFERMGSNGYRWFKQKFLGNLFNKLNEIYSLIVDNKIAIDQFKIVLNDNLQFKSIKNDQLMVKKIETIVQEIFLLLEIDIKHLIIKDQVSKVFQSIQSQKYFDEKVASQLIVKMFGEWQTKFNQRRQLNLIQKADQQNEANLCLSLIFSLLLTLNQLPQKTTKAPTLDFNKIKKFTLFSQIEPLKVFGDIKQLASLNKHLGVELTKIFIQKFSTYFQKLQTQYQLSFSDLCKQKLKIQNEDEGVAFFKQLFSDSLFGEKLSSSNLKMSFDKTFQSKYLINRLADNIEYPNDNDIQIHQILKHHVNVSRNLKQRLIMPIYPKTEQIYQTNYLNLFQDVRYGFNSLNEVKQYQVLNYLKSIYDQFTKGTCVNPTVAQKYNAWKDLIDQRVIHMFNLKNRLKTFESEPIKDFLYDLFDNENQLKKAAQSHGKRNHSKESISEVTPQNKSTPNKKLKKE